MRDGEKNEDREDKRSYLIYKEQTNKTKQTTIGISNFATILLRSR
jgi:hypothetical protein